MQTVSHFVHSKEHARNKKPLFPFDQSHLNNVYMELFYNRYINFHCIIDSMFEYRSLIFVHTCLKLLRLSGVLYDISSGLVALQWCE